jgi:hypothetical protein
MFIRALVFVSMFAVGGVAWAGGKLKPGKYQTTAEMEMNGQKMPPQTDTRCIDAKETDIDAMLDQAKSDPTCELKNVKKSAGKVTFDVVCKPPKESKGHGEITYSAEEMDMTVAVTANNPKAGEIKMNMHSHSKRVGDCP